MNEKVTVVLPIYNVEAYLERCIISVVNQTYRNLEIILVDDGSTDGCPKICEHWAKKDNRIIVVHKKNEGLGMARNTGIDYATGKYICFFDSDDYVASNMIEKCYEKVNSNNADIVVYGFYNVDSSGKIKGSVIPKTKRLMYEGSDVTDKFLPDLIAPNIVFGEKTDLRMSAWSCFYSMDLIKKNSWRFVSERQIISEDIYSLLLLYKSIKCVCVLTEALYYYCENETSLTHIYRRDRYEKIKYFYDQCILAQMELGYNAEVRNRLAYPYISNTIAALKLIQKSGFYPYEKMREKLNILKDAHLRSVIQSIEYPKESFNRKLFMKLIEKRMYLLCSFAFAVKK